MHKISIFFVIGLIQLGIDTIIYFLLSKSGLNSFYANCISRFFAACIGYMLNSRYTFSANPQSALMFSRFIIYWLAMTLLGSGMLSQLNDLFRYAAKDTMYLLASKIAVEGVLFILSYAIAKLWVFKEK